jgi:hypothetical protein
MPAKLSAKVHTLVVDVTFACPECDVLAFLSKLDYALGVLVHVEG